VPPVKPRLTVVTLGVGDLARSRAFYEALGWRSDSREEIGVVFFPSGDMVLALWGREELAQDSAVSDSGGWGGVTLAHNVRSPEDVDRMIDTAERAGAAITRAPAQTFWGGYSGVFVDPDGHPWEVAHNPHWTLTPDGGVELPR
jgi:catechol 2,3-dioxygenase-like lactoylglutathione lyase family enzyme